MKSKIIVDRIRKWSKNSPIIFTISVMLVVISSVVTLVDGVSKIRKYYMSSVGYKKQYYKKIKSLSAGVQISYFTDILGNPQIKNNYGEYIEFVYVNDYFYTQAITNLDEKVLVYAITTRKKKFNPIFNLYDFGEIELGKTKFSDFLGDHDPQTTRGTMGARRFYFYEIVYFGNPGNYQNFLFGINDAGYLNKDMEILGLGELHGDKYTNPNVNIINKVRSTSVVNTLAVSAPFINLEDIFISEESIHGLFPGGNKDQVKIVP